MLLTWHNLAFYQDLMADMRGAIEEGRVEAFAGKFLRSYSASKDGSGGGDAHSGVS